MDQGTLHQDQDVPDSSFIIFVRINLDGWFCFALFRCGDGSQGFADARTGHCLRTTV